MDARFDALAIGLAGAVSRRDTLRWVGAFIAGALLDPLGNRLAWAQGKDACFDFCDEFIDRKDTRSRISCRLNCQKCKRNSGTVCLSRERPKKGIATPSACASPGQLIRCPIDGRCCLDGDECCGSPSACCTEHQVCDAGECVRCPGGVVACRGQYDGFNPFSQCCATTREFCDPETQRCVSCDPGIVNCEGRCCAPGEFCSPIGECTLDAGGPCPPGQTMCGSEGRYECCGERGPFECCTWRGGDGFIRSLCCYTSESFCCKALDGSVLWQPNCCPKGYTCCPDGRCGLGITCN